MVVRWFSGSAVDSLRSDLRLQSTLYTRHTADCSLQLAVDLWRRWVPLCAPQIWQKAAQMVILVIKKKCDSCNCLLFLALLLPQLSPFAAEAKHWRKLSLSLRPTLLASASLSVHSRNEQIVAITLCHSATSCVAYLLAPHCCCCCYCCCCCCCCRCDIAVVKVAWRCMLNDACRQHIKHIHPSIHPSACPSPWRANQAPNYCPLSDVRCPLSIVVDNLPPVHCLRNPSSPIPIKCFCIAINVITFSNCIKKKNT